MSTPTPQPTREQTLQAHGVHSANAELLKLWGPGPGPGPGPTGVGAASALRLLALEAGTDQLTAVTEIVDPQEPYDTREGVRDIGGARLERHGVLYAPSPALPTELFVALFIRAIVTSMPPNLALLWMDAQRVIHGLGLYSMRVLDFSSQTHLSYTDTCRTDVAMAFAHPVVLR